MIRSWSDCHRYVSADLRRHGGGWRRALVMEVQVRWLVRLRLTEWWCNTRGGPVGLFLRWRLAATGARWGYSIPINRLGPGVKLTHVGTIAVNGGATVGGNCQILPDVVLGGNDQGAPTIEDDVYLGPGVKVIGPVTVGRGSVLVAGAVVVSDVPAGVVAGGVPAKVLGDTPGLTRPS